MRNIREELALLLVKYKGRFDSMQELADRLVADLDLENRLGEKTTDKPDNDPYQWALPFVI